MIVIIYISYLLSLLFVIAFSPTREFNFALIAFYSITPGLAYCIVKYPSKIQTYLICLLILSYFSGKGSNFLLYSHDKLLTDIQLIASSALWLISYLTVKIGLYNRFPYNFFKAIFTVFYIVGFYFTITELAGPRSLDTGSNSGYYILPFLPVMMYYWPKYKYYILALTFIVILTSIKRSSVIIIAMSLVWLAFCTYKRIIKIKATKTTLIIVIIVLLLMTFAGIYSVYINGIIERFTGISEDGGSHRDLIYLRAIDIISDMDTYHLIIGYGPRYFWYDSLNNNAIISSAHNDFLEITISCGLIGLLIFILLHIQLIKMLIQLVKMRKPLAILYGINYFSFLTWNLVGSQFAYQAGAIGVCIFWAIVEKKTKEYEKDSIHRNISRYGRRSNEHPIAKN